MQKVRMRMVLSMPLAFCLCANLAAQTGRIQSMKLLYIPGAKTRIPAELVTCGHICDST
jgi:hypothetical protein